MRQMTAKERVLTAFAHQEPDRVPINYDANGGIDQRLKAHFKLAADDHEGLRQRLGVDFRGFRAGYVGPALFAPLPGRHVDPVSGIHTRWIEHQSGGYWDYCDFPLRDASAEELATWPLPDPDHFNYSAVAEVCARNQQYCIYYGDPGLGDIINASGMLRTMEQVLVDLATDDEGFLRFIQRRVKRDTEIMYRTLEAAHGGVDLVWMGEDLGTQHAPLISLELYRRHLRPLHQQYIDVAKAFNLPVIIHSCGSSSWAYDDFIAMGINIVDTLQPEALNMSPAYLKARYGDKLAFHGCISTAGPLAFGTVDDVVANVRETLRIMMPGGGYALSPTHAIQDNSPTENVVAMYEAAMKFGQY
jgi:uroporphyrinogen decarboxylase